MTSTPSAIDLVIARLGQVDGLVAPIRPVRPAATGPTIVVNRLHEQSDDDFTHAVVAVTCMADTFSAVEQMSAAAIDALRDTDEPFNWGGAEDVLFSKIGSDVTGFDDKSGRFLRQIEFGVEW